MEIELFTYAVDKRPATSNVAKIDKTEKPILSAPSRQSHSSLLARLEKSRWSSGFSRFSCNRRLKAELQRIISSGGV